MGKRLIDGSLTSEMYYKSSILVKREPLTEEIAQRMTGTVFVDIISNSLALTPFVAYRYGDEIIVDGTSAGKLTRRMVSIVRRNLRIMLDLYDGMVVIGQVSEEDEHVACVDLYQKLAGGYGAKSGSGWIGPTFAPAYFDWVLRVPTIERRCVFRYGISRKTPEQIAAFWGGTFSEETAIVRSGIDGIHNGDDRGVYFIQHHVEEEECQTRLE